MNGNEEFPQLLCCERYHALVENFPNGVLVLFDSDLNYQIVGPGTLPFSKRDASDMVGKSIHDLFPSETVSVLEPKLRATIDCESRSFDIRYEGRIHHIETSPTSIDSERYGVLVTQEVTEQRQLAEELDRERERLDQFASMISHDLQNPLSIAYGRLELYQETGDATHLEAIEDALDRMDELTSDLTRLARHGIQQNEHEPVSLATTAQVAWDTIDTRSATLSTEDTTISGDDGQLRALFENLFRNAVGHGGQDVTVRVGSLDDGFFVEDTGKGIPPEKRERVFEHGFSTGYEGRGVGLTIVSRIAEAHGFDVSLSESSEGGARFEFRQSND